MRRFWQDYNSRIARIAVYALSFVAALRVSDALHVTNGFAWFGIGLAASAAIYGVVIAFHLLNNFLTGRLPQAERQRVGRLSASLINLGVLMVAVASVALLLLDYVSLSTIVAIGSLLAFIVLPFVTAVQVGFGTALGNDLYKRLTERQKKQP